MTYDNDNIFAKILRGEIPAHKVYEDDLTFAFLDVMPRANGHTLIIPKTPARNLFDIEADTLGHVIKTVQKIAIGVKQAMACDGITLHQFNETAGGQVIFHIHFHILPRWDGDTLRPHTGEMANQELLEKHAEKIKIALGNTPK